MLKLHADEFDIDLPLVQRLIVAQFPKWARLAIRPVLSLGTDHALYRLGHDMVVRLPRIRSAALHIEKEHLYLPKISPLLPFSIPIPLGKGQPCEDYPCQWSIFNWLEGKNPEPGMLEQPDLLATDLAIFINALHKIKLPHVPKSNRWDLMDQDTEFCQSLKKLDGLIDTKAAAIIWQDSLKLASLKDPVLIHGDLLPGNLLINNGRLSAGIDFGLFGLGDPAVDLIPAWALLANGSRKIFRDALSVDYATWERGRAWALSIGVIALPYYRDSHPAFADVARYAIQQVVEDQ